MSPDKNIVAVTVALAVRQEDRERLYDFLSDTRDDGRSPVLQWRAGVDKHGDIPDRHMNRAEAAGFFDCGTDEFEVRQPDNAQAVGAQSKAPLDETVIVARDDLERALADDCAGSETVRDAAMALVRALGGAQKTSVSGVGLRGAQGELVRALEKIDAGINARPLPVPRPAGAGKSSPKS